MGCDIPDIEVAVIYGMDSFVLFVQKGGRARRDGKAEAKMVWLVEDWAFEDSSGVGGKRAEERWAKVDPLAREYIGGQRVGVCLREFMNRVFRPHPHALLDLPGFNEWNPHNLDIVWIVEGEETHPEAGKCCSAKSCCLPGFDLDTGTLDTQKAATNSRHRLILNILRPETSAAEEILGTPPGKEAIRCPKGEKEIFRMALEQWRTGCWESICSVGPMLSREWVLGEYNIKKLVDRTRLVINTPVEKIDRQWVRALIDTISDDATVDELSSVIRQFHSGFFARLNLPKRRSGKQPKVSGSGSQQCPPSPATSTFTQDSYLDPDYPPSQHYTGTESSRSKRKRVERPQTIMHVSISLACHHSDII